MTIHARQPLQAQWVAAGALATGAVVSVALGVFGTRHEPTGQATWMFGFPDMISMKVWLGVVAAGLAMVQLTSALWLFGKLGRPAGRAVGIVHRLSGTAAVLVSLPVAFHCLWSLGFQSYDARVLAHALLGCAFYGAFVTKILTLHVRTSPGWLLPVAGGLLLSALVLVTLTSSFWYLSNTGLPPGSGS
jgi:Family of unknown function (DUF6529)